MYGKIGREEVLTAGGTWPMRTFSMALLTRELENNLKPECDSGGARCLCSERMMPTIRQTDFLALRQKPHRLSSDLRSAAKLIALACSKPLERVPVWEVI